MKLLLFISLFTSLNFSVYATDCKKADELIVKYTQLSIDIIVTMEENELIYNDAKEKLEHMLERNKAMVNFVTDNHISLQETIVDQRSLLIDLSEQTSSLYGSILESAKRQKEYCKRS